jgi:hypothetical protein
VPAAGTALERGAQCGELLARDARCQRLAVEADADALLDVGQQWSSAGWTISVRTPPVEAGWTNATREPRMPIRGVSSIRRVPAALSDASTASMSATW